MRYYVVADVHGFYDYLIKALDDAGYFKDTKPHKLIICGDLLDRGQDALKMQEFVLDLINKDEVILIRGNHEDLFVHFIDIDFGIPMRHHVTNGTYDTALQLTGITKEDAYNNLSYFVKQSRETPFYKKIIPSMLDYFETDHYIFVHGWIPMKGTTRDDYPNLEYIKTWRSAQPDLFKKARWENGMLASLSIKEEGKTIVCGHWHTSFGHCYIEHTCNSEFGEDADFKPYYGNGIIAIDACTAYSKMVNCIVIDD